MKDLKITQKYLKDHIEGWLRFASKPACCLKDVERWEPTSAPARPKNIRQLHSQCQREDRHTDLVSKGVVRQDGHRDLRGQRNGRSVPSWSP